MNPEIDLENLDLPEEESEDTLAEIPAVAERNIHEEAEETVIEIIGQNVFDRDLEQSLLMVVRNHFKSLSVSPPYHSDAFRIPDLNMALWDAFHNYEDFVHDNKFENIDLNEIARIIREQVIPKITAKLWDLTTELSQQS